KPRSMPLPLLSLALNRMWKMRLTTFPAPELEHLRFVCMVDDSLARETLGFVPEYDLTDTLGHLRLTKLLDGG
ncbi:MAG: hypothetical protein ACPGQS_11080, partial [Bradymonadia bacterium]